MFMLYFCMMTVFLSLMVWDTQRVDKNRGDFCGICCCQENTILCCKGICLSDKQKEYSSIKVRKVSDVKTRFGDTDPDEIATPRSV